MKRRKFIKYIAGSMGIALVSGYIFLPSFFKTVEKMIFEDLGKLQVNKSEFQKFITESKSELYWHQFDLLKQFFIVSHKLFENIFHLPYHEKYIIYRSNITGQFLLSTDFFLNKMDVDREIKYLSFYNPYKRPCGNPFSNLYYT